MQLARRPGFVALAALGGAVALATVAYAVQMRAHEGEVAPRVRLAGVEVSGMDGKELASTVERIAERYERAEVRVQAPGGRFTTPASTLGLQVDRQATIDDVMAVGRGGLPFSRVWSWSVSLLSRRTAAVAVQVDRTEAARVLADKDPGPHHPAVEPDIRYSDEEAHFIAVAGKTGRGIVTEDVASKLSKAAGRSSTITVSVGRDELKPRFDIGAARRVAREADRLVRRPVQLTVVGARTEATLANLRLWAHARPTGNTLQFEIDGAKVVSELAKRFPKVGNPAQETKFNVVDGKVQIMPGHPGTSCCDPVVAQTIEAVLRGRHAQPVDAPLQRSAPKISAEQAAGLGIKEVVGSFTTHHPPGQPRVKNIHRIADLVRGQVILPGTTFSMNAFVGKRTAAKGFVSAPVIQEGLFAEDFGGGVSQFATTFFNAGFLAGLEFPEYQSHSIYISRYPYGREATLNYPHPDLKIRNSTPYGVLIWPTYTGGGITVTLYSTKYWKVTQTGQTKTPQGVCTRVRTDRKRVRITDELTKLDAVFATYRPEEGTNCNGTHTGTSTTMKATTTAKPPATTTTIKPPVTPPPTPPTTAATTSTTAPPPPP